VRIGIIGCNAAGISAASAARKNDRKAEIFLVESEEVAAYSRCGLPHAISGEVTDFANLIVFPRSYYKLMRLDLRLRTTAKSIDLKEKRLVVEYEGKEECLQFDRLVLATGSNLFSPPARGMELAYHLRTIADGKGICAAAEASSSAVIVGGGLIGLEMAVALRQKGLKISLVEMLPQIAPNMLDSDMAQILQGRLEQRDIEILTGSTIQYVQREAKSSNIVLSTGSMKADLVIAATGIRPNTELARSAGLRIGESGGIWVNPRLQTSVEDIYAAGECVELLNFITGRPVLSQFGTSAVRSGRVAGTNAAGGYATMPRVLNSAVSKLFETQVGVTGLTESQAEKQGLTTISGIMGGKTKAPYYPGSKNIFAKLTFNRENMKLVGAQIIGEEEVTQRINMLSMAIKGGMTVWDLELAETCYTPPLAEPWEVSLHEASQSVLAKMKNRKN